MSVSESDTSPPLPRASGLQYILRFVRFYARYGPGVRGQGGSSKRTILDCVGGGVQNVFDGWPLTNKI